jgi:pyrimidine deaminase RibD-like protein
VIFAVEDPTPGGRGGSERLAEAGIGVKGGVLTEDAERAR